ncbi:Pao retrotransposon peptidase family protein [Trichinella spiralis]|uniref:Pao retrotransposon peptidase family protein n=1 Tax=Trichinella spiralis TaxID=6334 RepID=UPI0001EFD595|nr:Pao retrotransposon peptidase family protein [Trichinella spiralis]
MKFKTVQFSFLVLRLSSVLCVPELFESFSILFLVMAQYPELHLVPNRCGIWSSSVDKEGYGGAMWTDLEVPAGMDRKDHVETCREYSGVIRDYLDRGWAEKVDGTSSPPGRTWYLPHYAVYQHNQGKKKYRVVFDGSAEWNGTSLNNCLDPGPKLQPDLVAVLLRFRRYRIALQADIEKMYLQVGLRPEDRDICRFLWQGRDCGAPVKVYRLTRMGFGLTCSPFLAMQVGRHHAQRRGNIDALTDRVLSDMYVDDLATSCDEVEEARHLVQRLTELMKTGGFALRKWASNDPDTLLDLPPEDVSSADWIGCGRRSSLWLKGLNWDDQLPLDINSVWCQWKRELETLDSVRVPRALMIIPRDQIRHSKLHVFGDASETAFGTVPYLMTESMDGVKEVRFCLAKTRVAPVKRLSLPRLELMAALHMARLKEYVERELGHPFNRSTYWSDSTIVLSWIQGDTRRWKPFVANRFQEILSRTDPGLDLDDAIVFENCQYYVYIVLSNLPSYKSAEEHTARLREVLCRLMKRKSACDALKYHLTSAPVFVYPDFHRQFIVDMDASGDGLGAVLSQREEKAERVVAYASRTLTKAERRYCATRREMLGLVWALREFRPYLYGQRFLVRTYHSCLRWLTTFKEPEGQVARWLESLAELNFEVEHRAGHLHGNVDALSRTSCTQCGRLSFKDQLLAAQQADPEIRLLQQWLVGASWPVVCPPECSRYMHVLWRQRRSRVDKDGFIWRHRRGLTAEEGVKQELVPRALRNEVLQSMHDSRYAGHLGEQRTLARVRNRFYWPGMSGDVHTLCRTCMQCARRKGPTKNNRAPMQAMAAGYHLQRVGIDILGPLEKTPSRNRYVLVLTDYFTKWTAAFPFANMEASTVAKVLVEKYIACLGALDNLHSDQGRSFEASVVLEMFLGC